MKNLKTISICTEKDNLIYNEESGCYEIPLDLIKDGLSTCFENFDTKIPFELENYLIEQLIEVGERSKMCDLTIKLLQRFKQDIDDDAVMLAVFNTMLTTLKYIKREYVQ